MKKLSLTATVLFVFALLASTLSAFGQNRLIISQMYGGGGNTGAEFTNDFVELYNPTSAAISLNGLSLQYAAATSASWNAVALPNVSVAPGHYFLIQAAAGTTVTNVPLSPAADFVVPATGSTGNALNFSATVGKVIIANGTAALAVACPAATAYVDLIGFGSTANCFEGTGPAPAPTNTTADIRTNLNVDNVNNATDFSTGAPAPHNSGSSSGPVTPTTLAIHDIQGVKSLIQTSISPVVGTMVTTTGIVTGVGTQGFFIQAPDATADSNPLTPEGIFVFTSSTPPASAVIGNIVQVTGTVATFHAVAATHIPGSEITTPSITLLSTGNPLPTPIQLTTANVTPGGGIYQLTPYEGMRVAVASLTTVSGSDGGTLDEKDEIYGTTGSSVGQFYAVITGTNRPFQEPGIDLRDTPIPGAPANIPVFDDNPERIEVSSTYFGSPALNLSSGAVLTNVTGVLDFTFTEDSFDDPAHLLIDKSYSQVNVTPGMTPQPVPPAVANQFTVASFNIERFYNTNSADDLYFVPAGVNGFNGSSNTAIPSNGQTFISEAVDLTPIAYQTRLTKLSLAIRNVLNLPDVVTLEEVENQSVANDIANQINTDANIPNLSTAPIAPITRPSLPRMVPASPSASWSRTAPSTNSASRNLARESPSRRPVRANPSP